MGARTGSDPFGGVGSGGVAEICSARPGADFTLHHIVLGDEDDIRIAELADVLAGLERVRVHQRGIVSRALRLRTSVGALYFDVVFPALRIPREHVEADAAPSPCRRWSQQLCACFYVWSSSCRLCRFIPLSAQGLNAPEGRHAHCTIFPRACEYRRWTRT